MRVFSIGHSNRTWEQLLGLLLEHGVQGIADIRRQPGSTRYPQFDRQVLAALLDAEAIRYNHLSRLGGRRSGRVAERDPAVSGAWQNASFQRYAEYMQTQEFSAGLEELLALADQVPTAMICSEAVWWRCHRRLVADALVVRGVEVRHILSRAPAKPHVLTPFAHIEGHTVTYPQTFRPDAPEASTCRLSAGPAMARAANGEGSKR